MALINLTPHTLTIVVGDKKVVLPPSGTVARVSQKDVFLSHIIIDDVEVPVVAPTYGPVEGLPEPDGNLYVVSRMVKSALSKGRDDVFVPGAQIRDTEGRIVGCAALSY